MTIRDKATLKSYFETGDVPTQVQFGDLVDSFLHSSAPVVANLLNNSGVSVQNVFKAEMPTGTGFAKTVPFVIRSTIAYFAGDGGISPDQPFGIGRMADDPQDITLSMGLWVHEIDYNPHGTYTVHERYDVLRSAGPGSSTYWDYPSGDFQDSRRGGYAYEAFSNDLGDPTRGTLHAAIIADQIRFTSNYCNPSNPSVGGELGDYGSIFPNQATGAVVFTIGTRLTENLVASVTPTISSLTGSGDLLVQGTGAVSLVENDQNLSIQMNAAGGKQISIYADGTGKSVRIGASAVALVINQTRAELQNANLLLDESYDVTASHLRVRVGGLVDLYSSDPGKMGFATGDGYTVLCAARDSTNASYTMFGASGFHKSFTLKPDMKIGWGTTVTDEATSAFRLNSGVIEAVNASDALIDFACNNLKFGTHTASSDAPVSGYVTINDAAGNARKLAVIT